jgi:tRNA wybutosine-synthesizing protein 3
MEEFERAKREAIKKFLKACDENKVDREILPLLNKINERKEYYTSSSCAGRILLLEIPHIGDKKNAKFLGKWHRKIEVRELEPFISKAKKGVIWLLAQSPIIHIATNSYESADRMVKIANSCGFKNSSIKSIGKKIVVEVCSTERLDVPIGKDGFIFCNQNHLKLLVEISNEVIEKSKRKIERFTNFMMKDNIG